MQLYHSVIFSTLKNIFLKLLEMIHTSNFHPLIALTAEAIIPGFNICQSEKYFQV